MSKTNKKQFLTYFWRPFGGADVNMSLDVRVPQSRRLNSYFIYENAIDRFLRWIFGGWTSKG